MMDIYQFIDSKDIREHLRSLDYPFTAAEAAFLVWHSESRTLSEKFAAWEEIINTMPDCALPGNEARMDISSIHGFLREYIVLQKRLLDLFYCDKDNAMYTRDGGRAFTNCTSALNSLKGNHRTLIWMTKIWQGFENKYLCLCFDLQKRPVYIEHEGLCNETEAKIDHVFDNMYFIFPTPFKRGDILGQRDQDDGSIRASYVLDYLDTWTTEEMLANGLAADSPIGIYSDAGGHGYTTVSPGSFNEYSCVGYGSFRDYLCYERIQDDLEGYDRVLYPISAYLKGELGLDLLINAIQVIGEETRLDAWKEHSGKKYPIESLRLAGLGHWVTPVS